MTEEIKMSIAKERETVDELVHYVYAVTKTLAKEDAAKKYIKKAIEGFIRYKVDYMLQ